MLEWRDAHFDLALPLLEQGAGALSDDGFVQGALGRALMEQFRRQAEANQPAATETLARASATLVKAVDLSPNDVDVLVQLASAYLMVDGDAARAIPLLERAVQQVPTRERYQLVLTQAYLRQDDTAKATAYLGPLMARGSPEIRDAARRALAAMADRAARSRPSLDVLDVLATGAAAAPLPPIAPGSAVGGGYQPVLRRVAEGEIRIVGIFMSVECKNGLILFRIETDGRPLLMQAKTFSEVEFFTYRQEPPGSVGCGPQSTPTRVAATYRSGPGRSDGVVGQAVAIELLPDGDVLK